MQETTKQKTVDIINQLVGPAEDIPGLTHERLAERAEDYFEQVLSHNMAEVVKEEKDLNDPAVWGPMFFRVFIGAYYAGYADCACHNIEKESKNLISQMKQGEQ